MMKKQIRIYYECLEQGANFIKPIIERSVDSNTEIVLVRRPKKASDLNEGSIAALLTMTTPDALITGIYDDKEVPLILVEFTEAVTTEDHELQRTYGAIAAYLSGAYYLKLAGEKRSEKEFGGATYNPYTTPKIFIEAVGYEGYILAEWRTKKNNLYTLQRNKRYPSCPPKSTLFTDTIRYVVEAFVKGPTDWFTNSLCKLKKQMPYKQYRKRVDAATGTEELLETWKTRRDNNLNKLRYFVSPNGIGAKINRFSHAMDPDRGILTFISFLFSKEREVLGVYALVRPRGGSLMKQSMETVSQMQDKLTKALEMDKGGLPEWLVAEFQKVAKNANRLDDVVDFQYVWEEHRKEIKENKVVITLAYFLDGIKFNHNGIKLVWDKRKLVNTNSRNFIPAFAHHFGFTKYVKPTPIVEINDEVDEDEVTYAIVHRVLIPNGFKIVSVSYPGSQGSSAVLPNPELGKAQPREYPDIIAMPPSRTDIDVVLNESKGMFTKVAVEKDLEKMLLYKTDKSHKIALKENLVVAQVMDRDQQLRNIVVGVSFGINKEIFWNPANVDFVFTVKKRKYWAILYNDKLSRHIKSTNGQTKFPQIFKCEKNI